MLRLEGIQRRETKLIKEYKKLQLQREIEEIRVDYFTRKKIEVI